MSYMPVTDAIFLLAETREQPMHVGGLELFVPREGQTATELAVEIFETFRACTDIDRSMLKRPAAPVSIVGNVAWTYDETVDFDHHVRRAVLPRPGRIRELLRYVSLNHGALLDRQRPMWEVHIIEGLTDGRVAVYSKLHHSLVDGVSALRMLQRSLSPDPEDRSGSAPWDPALKKRRRAPAQRSLVSRLSGIADTAGQVAGMGQAVAKVAYKTVSDSAFVSPGSRAPRTILNVPIGSGRRFASDQWETARMRSVASALGITLNDVVVAMCAGALRSYLIDHDALPDKPLLAAVPVSMHSDDDSDGNAVTIMKVNLATDQPDPERRVQTQVASARKSKAVLRGLSPLQQLAFGGATIAPLAFGTVPGYLRYTPPQFNVIISNVPGPAEHLYWNGARLDGCYPVSIPLAGQALNITVTSTAEHFNFGFIGARAQLPSLQRLLTHVDTALEELEKLAHVATTEIDAHP